jgi:Na+/H+ antiporter NhaD/arsenite permease-like protein
MVNGIIAVAIFIITLYLMFSEKLNRTIAGLFGAATMLLVGKIFGFFNESDALGAIDFSTLGLLLGMMILVVLLEPTGLFEFVAIKAGQISEGKPGKLLVLLGLVTTIFSMFLNNVTTVILIAPVTILICELVGFNPTPFLIAEALLSDTGGIATLIGDPPNVLIAAAADLTFNDFLTHSLPIIILACVIVMFLLLFLFRKELSTKPTNIEGLMELNPNEVMKDRKTAFKVLLVLFVAIVLFFFEESLNMSPAVIALIASIVALIWIRPDPSETFNKIEWSLLIFFAALFVMVGGVENTGILNELALSVSSLAESQPLLFGVMLLWLVAILSAFLDNIPITVAFIPVVQSLAMAGVNVHAYWWALAFGAGLGGNGTIIGATANIVVASLSERTRYPITVKVWNKRGLPVMLVTLLITSVIFIIIYPYLAR